MSDKYKISEPHSPRGVCSLTNLKNVPNWAHLHQGEPQDGHFPEDAHFVMDPDLPKAIKLADVLDNNDSFLVVSERLLDLMKSADALAHNEVFEVGIVNHKGRREKAKYFLVHQIDLPTCVDARRTVGVKSPLDPVEYDDIEKLVLDEKKIGSDYAIFRPREYTARVFFRKDIAAKIESGGFTGIVFYDLKDYDDF